MAHEQETEHQTGALLYTHMPHPHEPRNVNERHKAEQTGLNTRIAVLLTRSVGTMWAAYLFVVLALIGLVGIVGLLSPTVVTLVAWASQTLIQLVMLPVIMVGQNVLGRKAELQADEQFATTQKTYSDIEQIMQHLSAQDAELLRQTQMIARLVQPAGPQERSTGVLAPAQERDVQALRQTICKYLTAKTEAFYAKHPELRLQWTFAVEAFMREEQEAGA